MRAKREEEEKQRNKPFDIHFVYFKGNKFRLREFAVNATVSDVKNEVRLVITQRTAPQSKYLVLFERLTTCWSGLANAAYRLRKSPTLVYLINDCSTSKQNLMT